MRAPSLPGKRQASLFLQRATHPDKHSRGGGRQRSCVPSYTTKELQVYSQKHLTHNIPRVPASCQVTATASHLE